MEELRLPAQPAASTGLVAAFHAALIADMVPRFGHLALHLALAWCQSSLPNARPASPRTQLRRGSPALKGCPYRRR
jgi:hypothetical protein